MAEKYYVQLPIPGRHGNEVDHFPVDPNRLNLSVLTQLWTRIRDTRSGGNRFKPAYGFRVRALDHPDISELLKEHDERLREIEQALAAADESGQFVHDQIVVVLQLRELAEALVAGQVAQAQEIMQDMLYGLMSGACEVAERLHAHETTVSGMAVGIDELTETVTAGDSMTRQFLEEAIRSAHEVLTVVAELQRMQGTLTQLDTEFNAAASKWRAQVDSSAEHVAWAREHLDGIGERSGYSVIVFGMLNGLIEFDAAQLAELTDDAAFHVEHCREELERARQSWRRFRLRAVSEGVPTVALVDDLRVRLSKASSQLRQFNQRFGEQTRPYELEPLASLITREQYERAQTLLNDLEWTPRKSAKRLKAMIGRLGELVETQPSYDRAIERMLAEAVEYIELARERLAEVNEPLPEPAASPEPPSTPEVESDSNSDEDEISSAPLTAASSNKSTDLGPISPERIEELYELMQCVGLVLTCKHHNIATSTVRAMMGVMTYLGLSTDEEYQQSGQAVRNRLNRKGERERVAPDQRPVDAWKTSTATWIVYDPTSKLKNMLKLTRQSRERVQGLLSKYSLTEETIVAAHNRRKADSLAAARARKRRKSS